MMPHVLTRSLDRSATVFILVVAGLGVLIPLSNLLLPAGSFFQVPTYLVALFGKVHGGSFTEAQIQTLLLTNAVTNGCSWAVAFHTGLALKEGLDQADVQAIRERRVPKDAASAALSLPRNSFFPSGNVMSVPFMRFSPSLAFAVSSRTVTMMHGPIAKDWPKLR